MKDQKFNTFEPYRDYIKSKDALAAQSGPFTDVNYAAAFSTEKIAVHWIKLDANQRTSHPHAEIHEEEFVFVYAGNPHLWVNGYLYLLSPGHVVGFPAGTGIAHCLINNTELPIELIVLGERTTKENKFYYPTQTELINEKANLWWVDYPTQVFGPHDGSVGNLNHLRDASELPFVFLIDDSADRKTQPYRRDTELFGEGVRLSDKVGLKKLGIWHEVLRDGRRSSWPHAHSLEEEFCLVLKGRPQVWLNGFIYDLAPGDGVFFKPGSNIAHAILNESNEDVIFLGLGQSPQEVREDKIIYPLNQTRNEECCLHGELWESPPKDNFFGEHGGVPVVKGIAIRQHDSAESFLLAAHDLLYAKEAEYSLMIGLTEARQRAAGVDDHFYFTVHADEKMIAAAMLTKMNMILTQIDEPRLLGFIEYLHAKDFKVPGVVGPSYSAEFFARLWSQFKDQAYEMVMAQVIYRLDEVTHPKNVEGQLGVLNESEIQLYADWAIRFVEESVPHEPMTRQFSLDYAKQKFESGKAFVWRNDRGEIVAVNSANRPTHNSQTVSLVYTPPELRRRGYASALVAGTSQALIDGGKKFCVLYTDAANPTSNRIYQAIGYRAIATSKNFHFRGDPTAEVP